MRLLVHGVTTEVGCDGEAIVRLAEKMCWMHGATIGRIAESEHIVVAVVGVSQSAYDVGAQHLEVASVCKHSSLEIVRV